MDEEAIEITLDVRSEQARKARIDLEILGNEIKVLKKDLDLGKISVAQFESGFEKLDRQVQQTKEHLKGLEGQIVSNGGKLQGASRSSAKAQLGLAGANIAQDVIQGGPGAAVNNLLGLAGSGGVRSLVGEFVEAAGGAGGLATKLGAVGLAAGAAFLLIDNGLKSAKLGWSDLDDVIGELGPIKAAGEAFAGVGEVLKGWGVVDAVQGAYDAVTGGIHVVADYTLGWDSATEAARAHRAEVERGVEAAREYARASKAIAGIKSDEQEAAAKTGKLVGGELANLGGSGGLDALADELARRATALGGDDKVKVPKLDKKGEEDGEEEITRREAARRRIVTDLAKAAGGDTAALDRLRPRLRGAGLDTGRVEAAAAGRDLDKEKREGDARVEKDAKRQQELRDQAAKDAERRAEELARPLQKGFNVERAAGPIRADEIRGDLERGGLPADEARRYADSVLSKLQEGFDEEIRKRSGEKGLTAEQARQDIVGEDEVKADQLDAKLAKEALASAEKAAAGSGLDRRGEDAILRSQLAGGGQEAVIARVAEQLAAEFRAKGLDGAEADLAGREKAEQLYAKSSDEIQAKALEGPSAQAQREAATAPQRVASADFARAVEGSGAKDQPQEKIASNTEAMKERLAELVRIAQMGPQLQ